VDKEEGLMKRVELAEVVDEEEIGDSWRVGIVMR